LTQLRHGQLKAFAAQKHCCAAQCEYEFSPSDVVKAARFYWLLVLKSPLGDSKIIELKRASATPLAMFFCVLRD
jgi:hypothetical protein